LLKRLLASRGLPAIAQVGCDWFPGIPDTFRREFPSCRVAGSLWHLIQNLKKNQRGRGTPKLRARAVWMPIAFVRASAVLPSPAMFSLFWSITLDRVHHVWGDGLWADYFKKQYLQLGKCHGEDRISASWHYGLQGRLARGHGPWQLPLEQCNGYLKNGIERVRKTGNMVMVVRELRKVAAMFSGPPADSNKGYSRKAPDGHVSASYPTSPSKWMLQEGKVVKSAIFFPSYSMHVPGLEPLLSAFDRSRSGHQPTSRSAPMRQKPGQPTKILYCMRIGRPGSVPEDMLRQRQRQVRCKSTGPDGLLGLWRDCGAISVAPAAFQDSAPRKIDFRRLRELWGQYCGWEFCG